MPSFVGRHCFWGGRMNIYSLLRGIMIGVVFSAFLSGIYAYYIFYLTPKDSGGGGWIFLLDWVFGGHI